MAEGLLNSIAKKNNLDIEAKSAGVYAFDGDVANKNAVSALEALGIDISGHKSQHVSKELVDEVDLILTMSRSHKKTLIMNYPNAEDKIFLLNEYAFDDERDIADPFGRDLHNYQITRDEILKALKSIKWDQ